MAQEHDKLFKIAFANPEAARSQLRALLSDELLAALDLDSLKLAPETLISAEQRELRSDRIYEVTFCRHPALIYVLYEHQSTVQTFMGLTVLRYLVSLWDLWLAQQDKDDPPTKLPPIIPVVLYHGKDPWDTPTSFADLLDLPQDLRPLVQRYLPAFEYVLDDVNVPSDEELRARHAPPLAAITLILFKHTGRGEDMLVVLQSMRGELAALAGEPDWDLGVQRVALYTLRVGDVPLGEFAKLVEESMGPGAKEVVVTTAEKLIQEGEKRGEERGRREGRLEGRLEGLLEGERRIFLRLLRTFFGTVPAEIEQRVASAAANQLETWTERVRGAGSIEDVFADPDAAD